MIDGNSSEWLAIKRLMLDKIELARLKLEVSGVDIAQTEKLRGEIFAYRSLIDHVEPKVRVPDYAALSYDAV